MARVAFWILLVLAIPIMLLWLAFVAYGVWAINTGNTGPLIEF